MIEKINKVAIALAVCNGEKWLKAQILSILKQDHISTTVFINIDYSSDHSKDICLRLSEKYKNLVLIQSNCKFGSGAKNFYHILKSINLSDFDYFAFSDQDDIWLPSKTKRAIDCMVNTGSHGYSSNLTAFNDERQWTLKKNHPQKRFDYLFQGASAGCTYVLSKEAAMLVQNKIKYDDSDFSVDTSHDWLTYAICRSHELNWFIDNESHILYRQHANNAYGAMNGFQGIYKKLKFIKSGWYRKHILWMQQFLINSPEEKEIIDKVKTFSIKDRIILTLRVFEFRRSSKEVFFLALLFLSGLLKKE